MYNIYILYNIVSEKKELGESKENVWRNNWKIIFNYLKKIIFN